MSKTWFYYDQMLGFIFLTGTKKPLGRGLEGPYEGL